ncbi:hypothetical protein DBB29_00095 [Pandoraea cepalis]|uniref:Chromosome partitioning protein ParB n=1 Tax=Pandoraea cepalis TaxID=2508294 RepID=A0AAW7MG50_9BURK|nr:hypothetical protein [Pandoraea cepalis]MDN4571685.1 hypothetical protein [Pandoraea cepalis]MDN4576541.1 hypothetical protein [Pandoraea cepalis]
MNAIHADNAITANNSAASGAGKFKLVPFNRLVESKRNVNAKVVISDEVRKQFADSISANDGLLQNLIVTFDGEHYPVEAGRKRFAGLSYLVAQGDPRFTPEYLVPVLEVADDDALIKSASENLARNAMRPAEEFEAFKAMIDEGRSIDFVAQAFNTTPRAVEQRLKLAQLSPTLFELFRDDKIRLDEMKVLTLAPSHADQESAWEAFQKGYWRDLSTLRSLIVKREINAATDTTALFVGVGAYVAAGGFLRQDLFGGDNSGYIADPELLSKLCTEKLEAAAADVKAEGWGWVEVIQNIYNAPSGDVLPKEDYVPTEAEAARLAAAKEEHEAAEMLWADLPEEDADTEEGDALYARREKAEDAVRNIEDELLEKGAYNPLLMKFAGAVMAIGQGGRLDVRRGIVRKEDAAAVARALGNDAEATRLEKAVESTKSAVKGPHSESLIRRLTANQTLAVQAEVAGNVDVALAVLLMPLIRTVFSKHSGDVCANVRAEDQSNHLAAIDPNIVGSAAAKAIDKRKKYLAAKLPKNASALFATLLNMQMKDRLELLAFCTAVSIDGTRGTEMDKHPIDLVGEALDLDMNNWWEASAETYLASVSRQQIAVVVKEAVGAKEAQAVEAMKKGEAVSYAAAQIKGKKWLPKVLRPKFAPKTKAGPSTKSKQAKPANAAAPKGETITQ